MKFCRKGWALSIVLVNAVMLVGCSESHEEEQPVAEMGQAMVARSSSADFMAEQKAENPNLAYQHNYSIEVEGDALRERYEATLKHCTQLTDQQCTIIRSSIHNNDRYTNADIQVRIKGEGVPTLLAVAAQDGEITSENIYAEDLTESIADIDTRLAMLESYRERLIALEARADQDIESLIKVTEELAQTQQNIERIKGQAANMQRRIALDLVTISLYAQGRDSAWGQIWIALQEFGTNLADAIAGLVTALAYILPWSILVLAFIFAVRLWWKRGRRSVE